MNRRLNNSDNALFYLLVDFDSWACCKTNIENSLENFQFKLASSSLKKTRK